MIKFIIPAIIVLLIVVFWEKITEIVFKKFNIKLNYIVVSAVLITIATVVLLINF
ncbi:actin family protein [Candidatus Pelagibacter sp.]|nr:actin family protein [Candidatus Pelagibacter sp.]